MFNLNKNSNLLLFIMKLQFSMKSSSTRNFTIPLVDVQIISISFPPPIRHKQQVTQAGEMLILTFGIQLAYASRNANTQFRVCLFYVFYRRKHLGIDLLNFNILFISFPPLQERQFLVASIVIEFVVSCSYYIIRDCYLSELNATTLFLALFIRSQLTNTITMVLIFLPKIYYQHKQVWFTALCHIPF